MIKLSLKDELEAIRFLKCGKPNTGYMLVVTSDVSRSAPAYKVKCVTTHEYLFPRQPMFLICAWLPSGALEHHYRSTVHGGSSTYLLYVIPIIKTVVRTLRRFARDRTVHDFS